MPKATDITTGKIGNSRVRIIRFITALLNYVFLLISSALIVYYAGRRGNPIPLRVMYIISLIMNVLQVAVVSVKFVLQQTGTFFKPINLIETLLNVAWETLILVEFVLACILFSAFRLDCLLICIAQGTVVLLLVLYSRKIDYRVDKHFNRSAHANDATPAEHAGTTRKKEIVKVVMYSLVSVAVFGVQIFALAIPLMPPRIDDVFSDTRVVKYTYVKNKTGYTDGYYVSDVYLGFNDKIVIPQTYNDKPVVGILEGAIKDVGVISSIAIGETNEKGELKSNIEIIEKNAINLKRIKTIAIPDSVKRIESGAIRCDSVETVNYYPSSDFQSSAFKLNKLKEFNVFSEERVVEADYDNIEARIRVSEKVYNGYRKQYYSERNKFGIESESDVVVIDFETNATPFLESKLLKKGEAVIDITALKNVGEDSGSYVKDTVRYNADRFTCDGFTSKDGYAFRGWYRDPEYTVECDFSGNKRITFDSSAKIYAKWEKIKTIKLSWSGYYPYNESTTTIKFVSSDKTGEIVKLPNLKRSGGDIVRTGYESLKWRVNEKNVFCEKTSDLLNYKEDNFTATAVWGLEKPTINAYTLGTDNVKATGADYSFTFDENSNVRYVADLSHTSDKVKLTYSWKKRDAAGVYRDVGKAVSGSNRETFTGKVRNVSESGFYRLEVTAKSNTGETSMTYSDYHITVNKKALYIGTFGIISQSKVYNGYSQAHNNTTGSLGENIAKSVTYNINGAFGTSAPKNVGKYPVKYTFSKTGQEAGNYSTFELNSELEITKKKLTVTWQTSEFVYNATEREVGYIINGKCGNDVVNFNLSQDVKKKDVGDYRVEITGVTNPNYEVSSDAEKVKAWRITPKKVTPIWESVDEKVYNGSEQSFLLNLSGICANDDINKNITVSMFETTSTTGKGTYNQTYSNSGLRFIVKNVGSYTFTVNAFNNKNYELDVTSKTFNITPAQLSVTWADEKEVEYIGKERSIRATISGFKNVDGDGISSPVVTEGIPSKIEGYSNNPGGNSVNVVFSATNAGKYLCKISDQKLCNGNYTLSASQAEFTITKKKLVGVWDNNAYTYNGNVQYATCTFTIPEADRDKIQFITDNKVDVEQQFDGTNSIKLRFKLSDAKDYNCSITEFTVDGGSENYDVATFGQSKTYTVKPYNVKGTWGNLNLTYDGEKTVTYTATLPTESDAAVFDVERSGGIGSTIDREVSGNTVRFSFRVKDAKDYPLSVTGFSVGGRESNFTFSAPGTVVCTVKPLEVKVGWSTDKFEYNGETHSVVATVENKVDGDELNLTYTGNSALHAGNYTAVVSVGNPNYTTEDVASAQKAWSISKKSILLSGSIDGGNTYDGSFKQLVFKISGFVASDLASISADGSVSFKISSSLATLVKTSVDGNYYVATYRAIDAGNYVASAITYPSDYSLGSNSVAVTIKPKTISYTWDYDKPFTYDKMVKSVHPEFDTSALCTRADTGRKDDAPAYSLTDGDKTNAGTYTATFTGITDKNYSAFGSKTLSWKIEKKALVVTWDQTEFVFNASAQYPRATATNLEAGDAVYFSYTYKNRNGNNSISTVNVNEYTVTASIREDSGSQNYVLGGNTSCDYSIKKRTLSLVAAKGTSLIYNGSNLSGATITISGFPNSSESGGFNLEELKCEHTSGVVVSGSQSGTDRYVYFASKNAGHYRVQITGTSALNYTFEKSDGIEYEISKRPVSISWGTSSFVYDGNKKTFGATIANVVGGDTVTPVFNVEGTSNTGIAPINNGPTVSAANAGSYILTMTKLSGSGSENYTLTGATGGVSKSFIIDRKPITPVITSAKLFTYNGSDQSVLIRVDGFVSQDAGMFKTNPFVVSSNLTVKSYSNSTITLKVKDAGNYNISVSGLNDTFNQSDYIFGTPLNETIVMNKRIVGINWGATSFVYNATERKISPVINNIASVDDDVALIAEGNSAMDSGTYTASVTGLSGKDAKNYALPTTTTTKWTISPKSISTEWSAPSYEYDGSQKAATLRVKGFIASDADLVTVSDFTYGSTSKPTRIEKSGDTVSLIFEQIDAGSYSFSVAFRGLKNYASRSASTGSMRISKRPVALKWEGLNYVYDGSEKSVSCRITNVCTRADGGLDNPIVTLSGNKATNAGSYRAVASINDSNYITESDYTHNWKIEKSPLSVSVQGKDSNYMYDGKSRETVIIVSGFKDAVAKNDFTVTGSPQFNYANGAATFTFTSKDAETYEFRVIYDKNNYDAVDKRVEFTVSPESLTATLDGATGYTYDGKSHQTTITVSGFKESVTKDDFTVTGDSQFNYANGAAKFTFTSKNAGAHVFGVIYNKDNYIRVNKSVTVNVDRATLNVDASGRTMGSYVYNGNKCNTLIIVSGFKEDVSESDFNVTGSHGLVFDSAAKKATFTFTSENAGSYIFGVAFNNDNYEKANKSVAFNVTAATLVTSTSGNLTDYVYDGKLHETKITVSGFKGTVTKTDFTVTGNSQFNYAGGTATFTFASEEVGAYAFGVIYNNNNYTSVSAGVMLNVVAAKLETTSHGASGYTYDGEKHNTVITVSGFKNTVTKTDFTVTGNSQFDYANGTATFTFASEEVGSYAFGVVYNSNNYTSVNKSVVFNVTTATLVAGVSGNTTGYTYDGEEYNTVITVSGFKKAVTLSDFNVTGDPRFNYADGTATFTFSSKNAGSYSLSVVIQNKNYKSIDKTVDFVVSPKIISCTSEMKSPIKAIYDGKIHETALIIDGIVNSDLVTSMNKFVSSAQYTPLVSGGTIRLTFRWQGAGNYTFGITSFTDNNYVLGETPKVVVFVAKCKLKVDESTLKSGKLVFLTASADNLQVDNVEYKYSVFSDEEKQNAVGEYSEPGTYYYDIELIGASGKNYELIADSGNFNVEQ